MPATLLSLVKRVPYLTQTSGGILVQRGSIYRPSFCLYPLPESMVLRLGPGKAVAEPEVNQPLEEKG